MLREKPYTIVGQNVPGTQQDAKSLMWNTLGSSSQSFYPRDTSAWVGGGGGKDGFWPWRGIVFIASWTKFLCLQVPSYQGHVFPNQPLTAQAADVLPFLRSAGRKRPSLKAHLGRFSSSCDIGLFQRASVCIPYPLVSCGHGKYPFPSFFFFLAVSVECRRFLDQGSAPASAVTPPDP